MLLVCDISVFTQLLSNPVQWFRHGRSFSYTIIETFAKKFCIALLLSVYFKGHKKLSLY